MSDDSISRQVAIKAFEDLPNCYNGYSDTYDKACIIGILEELPSAQPEVKPIDYQDCANAMLKMWMDNIVTDGEYNRIMDKLNAHWRERNG